MLLKYSILLCYVAYTHSMLDYNTHSNSHFAKRLSTIWKKEKRVFKRAATKAHDVDISRHPDIVFLVQTAGMTEEDFKHLKNFVGLGILELTAVYEKKKSSRVGLSFFTALIHHRITYDDCCAKGRSHLLKMINENVTRDHKILHRLRDQQHHKDLSPDSIDVEYGFRGIREKYLSRGEGRDKPTLIIFVANFQAEEASFWSLANAFDEIQACKEAGAWITVIIVDPLDERQPEIKEDVASFAATAKMRAKRQTGFNSTRTQKNHIKLRKFVNSRQFGDVILDKSYHKELKKMVADAKKGMLKSVVRSNEKRLEPKNLYKNLVLLFAQQMASRPEDGFKVRNYVELGRPPVASNLKRLIRKTASWFGDGEVNSTCVNTKHLSDRALWTPGYFRSATYPEGVHCQWMIRTRPGYFVNLKFDFFNTEDTFDPVTVYDYLEGNDEDIIVTLSGYFSLYDLPEVQSTAEEMMVDFKSDGGSSYTGFHATWTAMIIVYKLKEAQLVYSIDVSTSHRIKELQLIKQWIKISTSYFDFVEKRANNKNGFLIRNLPSQSTGKSKMGLLSFGGENKILRNVDEPSLNKTRFYQLLDNLNHTKGNTYVGEAFDYARLKQFRLLHEDKQSRSAGSAVQGAASSKLISGKGSECNSKEIAPRIAFVFTDLQSLDHPKPAADRLCDDGILPVVIRSGRVNLRGLEEAIGYCGLSYSINIPIPEIMLKIKNKTEPTTTTEATTSGGPTTTTKLTTTTTTTPAIPRTIYLPPYMQRLNYYGLAGLLIAIGIIQSLVLTNILYFNCCMTPFILVHSADSEATLFSEDMEEELVEKHNDDQFFDEPTPVNSFFTLHAAEEAPAPYGIDQKRKSNFEKNRKCCGAQRVVPGIKRKSVPKKFHEDFSTSGI